jgi:hypothetical protein
MPVAPVSNISETLHQRCLPDRILCHHAEQGTFIMPPSKAAKPTDTQYSWLQRGLTQPGGKLPLFDANGRQVPAKTVQACIKHGWAEPWFANPLKPDWLVCKLTPNGCKAAKGERE